MERSMVRLSAPYKYAIIKNSVFSTAMQRTVEFFDRFLK